MEFCPEEGACDFAKDVFTKIPDLSHNIAAFQTEAYWCDIGDVRSYRSVNLRGGGFIGEMQHFRRSGYSEQRNLSRRRVGAGSVIS